MADEIHGTITRRLRASRQRYTSGRRALVQLLLDEDRPVSIPDLLDAGAAQSQSSLYRNLATLEQCGVVRRLASIDDVARYELDEELTHHHHHLVCNTCGRIDDVTLPGALESALSEAAGEARRQRGYEVDSHRFELVGTCPGCA